MPADPDSDSNFDTDGCKHVMHTFFMRLGAPPADGGLFRKLSPLRNRGIAIGIGVATRVDTGMTVDSGLDVESSPDAAIDPHEQ